MGVTKAKGTIWKIDDVSSPNDSDTIGQLRAFSQSGPTATIQDITTHSTSGNWMEKLATLLDPGTVSGNINYDSADATHQFATGIWSDLVDLQDRPSRIIFAGGAGSLVFASGYFSNHSFDFPTDNVLGAALEYAINGAIVAAN